MYLECFYDHMYLSKGTKILSYKLQATGDNIHDYLLSLFYGSGLSAMSLAAQNGHIKVEKRLWLFNWNMNAINDTASNEKVGEKITEKEMEHQEVKQAAKQYQLQFHQR